MGSKFRFQGLLPPSPGPALSFKEQGELLFSLVKLGRPEELHGPGPSVYLAQRRPQGLLKRTTVRPTR